MLVDAAVTHSEDWEGRVVSEEEAAKALGFSSVADFRAWEAAGAPTGRCSSGYCWRPAFWPHLDEPCQWCGAPVTVKRARQA